MILYLQDMLDEEKVYTTVRSLRWADGLVSCPHCTSTAVVKNGYHNTQKARQRYICQSCERQFDDLTGTVFEGHHQPLEVSRLKIRNPIPANHYPGFSTSKDFMLVFDGLKFIQSADGPRARAD
jgi:DNA-directed RNA polymerase subunit RPC12/RpoP